MKRFLVFIVLFSLYLLHFDFWLWPRPEMVLGLPVGLLYHFVYCFVVSLVLAVLIRFTRSGNRTAE